MGYNASLVHSVQIDITFISPWKETTRALCRSLLRCPTWRRSGAAAGLRWTRRSLLARTGMYWHAVKCPGFYFLCFYRYNFTFLICLNIKYKGRLILFLFNYLHLLLNIYFYYWTFFPNINIYYWTLIFITELFFINVQCIFFMIEHLFLLLKKMNIYFY